LNKATPVGTDCSEIAGIDGSFCIASSRQEHGPDALNESPFADHSFRVAVISFFDTNLLVRAASGQRRHLGDHVLLRGMGAVAPDVPLGPVLQKLWERVRVVHVGRDDHSAKLQAGLAVHPDLQGPAKDTCDYPVGLSAYRPKVCWHQSAEVRCLTFGRL
jgi:hypothetical protein